MKELLSAALLIALMSAGCGSGGGSHSRSDDSGIESVTYLKASNTGWMDFFGTSKDIPLNERFYAGGPNSLRGFGYQLVGPLDKERDPIGGRLKVAWNVLEIRQSLYKMIGLAFFADVGNVWLGPKHFHFNDFRSCVGAGLRANTPIGIVRLDYGINLGPKEGEPQAKLYFNMGQAF